MATKTSSVNMAEELAPLIELLRKEGVRHFKRGDLEIAFEAAGAKPAIRYNAPTVTVLDGAR